MTLIQFCLTDEQKELVKNCKCLHFLGSEFGTCHCSTPDNCCISIEEQEQIRHIVEYQSIASSIGKLRTYGKEFVKVGPV